MTPPPFYLRDPSQLKSLLKSVVSDQNPYDMGPAENRRRVLFWDTLEMSMGELQPGNMLSHTL